MYLISLISLTLSLSEALLNLRANLTSSKETIQNTIENMVLSMKNNINNTKIQPGVEDMNRTSPYFTTMNFTEILIKKSHLKFNNIPNNLTVGKLECDKSLDIDQFLFNTTQEMDLHVAGLDSSRANTMNESEKIESESMNESKKKINFNKIIIDKDSKCYKYYIRYVQQYQKKNKVKKISSNTVWNNLSNLLSKSPSSQQTISPPTPDRILKESDLLSFNEYLEYWWNLEESEKELITRVCNDIFRKYHKSSYRK